MTSRSHGVVTIALALLLGLHTVGARAELKALDDQGLAEVTGQAMLDADHIVASAISAEPSADTAIPGLAFYRIGLDANVQFNANINRLQLGCGGVNDQIVTGCDIDLSNVSFMGSASHPVTSDFTLTRPFIELAIANDDKPYRQIVGFNVSSQTANGYLSLGNVYGNGQTNMETGATCTVSGTTHGPGCESGLNMLSGYLSPTFTGYITGCVSALTSCEGNYVTCLSPQTAVTCPTMPSADANGTPGTAISCTRCVTGETKLVGGATTTAYLWPLTLTPLAVPIKVADDLAYFHGISFADTADFGLSMQRQQLAWPTYDKTGWNPTTNTGWWMNAPGNLVSNVVNTSGPTISWTSPLTGALLNNLDLNQTPAVNCYGQAHYC